MISSFTKILRHTAPKNNLTIHPGGFIYLKEILDHAGLMLNFTTAEVKKCVETVVDHRFELKTDENNKLLIRATSGHTFPLEPLEDAGKTNGVDLESGEFKSEKVEEYTETTSKLAACTITDTEMEKLNRTLHWLLIYNRDRSDKKEDGFTFTLIESLLLAPQIRCLDVYSEDIIKAVENDNRFEIKLGEEIGKSAIRIRPAQAPVREKNVFNLRKALYRFLKHDGSEHGLQVSSDGYFNIDELLKVNHEMKDWTKFTKADIIEVVKQYPNQFEIQGEVSSSPASPFKIRLLDSQSIETKLISILRNDAVSLGLKVHQWGFISVEEILSLNLAEFENMSVDSMVNFITTFGELKPGLLILRRNPDKPSEIHVRSNYQHFETPVVDELPKEEIRWKESLSRRLSHALRHFYAAKLDKFGFIEIKKLVTLHSMTGHTEDEIVELVEDQYQNIQNEEGYYEPTDRIIRFVIVDDEKTGNKKIRATYGHSIPVCS